jgi:23S rRNA (adenine2503-C2)-methyltransferase
MALQEHNGNLLGLNLEELENLAVSFGQPRYRGRQIYHGIYVRRARDLSGLTDLNRDFRVAVATDQGIIYPQVEREFASRDGAVRYLFRLQDGNMVETVYMPEEDRTTLCLSSQVGCALDCRFSLRRLTGLFLGKMHAQIDAYGHDAGEENNKCSDVSARSLSDPKQDVADDQIKECPDNVYRGR